MLLSEVYLRGSHFKWNTSNEESKLKNKFNQSINIFYLELISKTDTW